EKITTLFLRIETRYLYLYSFCLNSKYLQVPTPIDYLFFCFFYIKLGASFCFPQLLCHVKFYSHPVVGSTSSSLFKAFILSVSTLSFSPAPEFPPHATNSRTITNNNKLLFNKFFIAV